MNTSESVSEQQAITRAVVLLPRELRSIQNRSLTFRDLVAKTGCMRAPATLSITALESCLSQSPELVLEWLRFSAEKRSLDGCSFRKLGEQTFEVGAADRPIALVVNGAVRACAAYILRELCDTNVELLELPPSSEHLLSIVDHVFTLAERGTIVVPGPRVTLFTSPRDFQATLRRPDGSAVDTSLRLAVEFVSPTPLVQRFASLLPELNRNDIPTGSQIWLHAERREHSRPRN
ncbi:MAG: hypothetical protein QM756_41965 [Polyangiaceae bacterium]